MIKQLLISAGICLSSFTNSKGQNYATYSAVKAEMHDPNLEHEAVILANKIAASTGTHRHESYSDAKIVSQGWEYERNATGRATSRFIHMELYGETHDGKCGIAHFVFKQLRKGDDTYSPKLRLASMGEFYKLKCE